MTYQINLLAWREKARFIKKIRLLLTLGFFIFLTLLLVLFIHLFYINTIKHQQKRNTWLKTKITENQNLFTELEKNKVEQNLTRKKIIFLIGLQEISFRAVRLFNELPKIIPSNITIIKMQRTGDFIVLQGIAFSNLDITTLMKKLKQSNILHHPDLSEISSKNQADENVKMFELKMMQRE